MYLCECSKDCKVEIPGDEYRIIADAYNGLYMENANDTFKIVMKGHKPAGDDWKALTQSKHLQALIRPDCCRDPEYCSECHAIECTECLGLNSLRLRQVDEEENISEFMCRDCHAIFIGKDV